MAVSAVGSGTSTAAKSGFSAMNSADFTKLIFTELKQQDPTQPSDTNQLLQQLSQIRSIQSDTDLSDRLTKLVDQNDFSSAAGLIGKGVSGLSNDNQRVAGVVASVSRTSDGTVVTLDSGTQVKMSNVDQVVDLTAQPSTGTK